MQTAQPRTPARPSPKPWSVLPSCRRAQLRRLLRSPRSREGLSTRRPRARRRRRPITFGCLPRLRASLTTCRAATCRGSCIRKPSRRPRGAGDTPRATPETWTAASSGARLPMPSELQPRASRLQPCAPRLLPHASRLQPQASRLQPYACRVRRGDAALVRLLRAYASPTTSRAPSPPPGHEQPSCHSAEGYSSEDNFAPSPTCPPTPRFATPTARPRRRPASAAGRVAPIGADGQPRSIRGRSLLWLGVSAAWLWIRHARRATGNQPVTDVIFTCV